MELTECIKGRRSIRNFKAEKVKDEDILLILESATFAPSAINKQPWNFIVTKDNALKKKMSRVVEKRLEEALSKVKVEGKDDAKILVNYSQFFTFFEKAPVVIAVLCRPITSPFIAFLEHAGIPIDELKNSGYSEIQSTSAAIQNLLLKAHELGLGTCWMTNPLIAAKELESLLQVKKPWYLMSIIPIGVPASIPPMPKRKKTSSVIKFI